jgi:methylated-DNA-[protein]-cysteine S-methyltransferase
MKNQFVRVDSPIGPLFVVTGASGVRAIAMRPEDEARCLAELDPAPADAKTAARIRRELRAYFAGKRRTPALEVDLSGVSGFALEVLRTLRKVRFGKTISYGTLARLVGRAGAARAVGRAVGSNPVPILVPCHRVIAADGSLGGFGGGLRRKRTLLELEGITGLSGGWRKRAHG